VSSAARPLRDGLRSGLHLAGRLGLVGLIGSVLVACGTSIACEPIPGVRSGVCPIPVEDRRPAPAVSLPLIGTETALAGAAWSHVDGPAGEASLASLDLAGRVVIVNFWASWCGPCRLEQPDLNLVAGIVPADEVVVVGVNIQDTEANALAHLREFDVPYVSLFDPVNELASRFEGIGARTIPSTVFLDHEGRVAARLLGLTDTREILSLASAIAAERALSGGVAGGG